MAEISKITLPSGNTYDIKDATARARIDSIETAIAGGMTVVGETSSDISDGSLLDTIVINNQSYRVKKGDLVWHDSSEFLWTGDSWLEVGDLSSIGALGYKDNASGSYTPSGIVSQPSFSGNEMFANGTFTPDGDVEIEIGNASPNYTPAGTVTQPSFSGNELSSTGSYTPSGTVTVTVGAGVANYTPSGSVSKPEIAITPSTDVVYSITDVGTLPELTATVVNENLTLGFSRGALPVKGNAQMVLNGASAELAAAPTFTGAGVDLEATFGGLASTITVTGTPTGSVSQPTFSGTAVEIAASFTGTQGGVSVTGTPTGTVSQPVFYGTSQTITVS